MNNLSKNIHEILIPHGEYCYDNNGKCPFWKKIVNSSEPEGFCSYLKIKDSDGEGLGLLWDQCKDCDVNID